MKSQARVLIDSYGIQSHDSPAGLEVQSVLRNQRSDPHVAVINGKPLTPGLKETDSVVGIVLTTNQQFRSLSRLHEVTNEGFVAATTSRIGGKLDARTRTISNRWHDCATDNL